jgi:hypothetical protein
MLGNCKESERGEEHITGTKGQELVQFKKRERGREGGREREIRNYASEAANPSGNPICFFWQLSNY